MRVVDACALIPAALVPAWGDMLTGLEAGWLWEGCAGPGRGGGAADRIGLVKRG